MACLTGEIRSSPPIPQEPPKTTQISIGTTGAPSYLFSPKSLQAHGGWESVVRVSPRIAVVMGDSLPERVAAG